MSGKLGPKCEKCGTFIIHNEYDNGNPQETYHPHKIHHSPERCYWHQANTLRHELDDTQAELVETQAKLADVKAIISRKPKYIVKSPEKCPRCGLPQGGSLYGEPFYECGSEVVDGLLWEGVACLALSGFQSKVWELETKLKSGATTKWMVDKLAARLQLKLVVNKVKNILSKG